ncbi:uncharacterized protein LOC128988827 isoform X3 [Macrosteles quadrilineatus]|uniref:uncharacterized protein LOC128988827 isoform X3 n=1 Tax=Macrosteles quadrilineatus TaxID=74068 RepID=UPI0023E305C6|nr:uncharacterized protein LOC128988827 isoform X3 [Macrosteles quadrilineatus]
MDILYSSESDGDASVIICLDDYDENANDNENKVQKISSNIEDSINKETLQEDRDTHQQPVVGVETIVPIKDSPDKQISKLQEDGDIHQQPVVGVETIVINDSPDKQMPKFQEGATTKCYTPSHEHPVAGFANNSIETIVIEDSSDRLREICEFQEGANTPSHEHPVDWFENSIETIVIEDSSDRLREICEMPPKILSFIKKLIIKAITSSTEKHVSFDAVVDHVSKQLQKKNKILKNLILEILENDEDLFMQYTIQINNRFESGYWTIRPSAAMKLVQQQKTTVHNNKSISPTEKKYTELLIKNRCHLKRLTVKLERIPALDAMSSMTQIIPSDEVASKLKNYGVNIGLKWTGWSSPESLDSKILHLEKIISNYNDDNNSHRATSTGNTLKSNSTGKTTSNENTLRATSTENTVRVKRKGFKRVRLSETSDGESHDIHKEHNYSNKDSQGSKNLIKNLQKIVQRMDKDSAYATDRQDKDGDFLGFDSDPSIGTWRGWDKASSQKLTKLNEVIKNLRGNRDLEEVLHESHVATASCLENERFHLNSEDKRLNPTTAGSISSVQMYHKELMTLFDQMAEEPPISYMVLIVMAICANVEFAATVEDICQFIRQHFPYHCREDLDHLVEVVLRLGCPSTFICQKSRRASNPPICWRIDDSTASQILARALHSAKKKKQSSPSKNTTGKYGLKCHDLPEENSSNKSQEKIGGTKPSISSDQAPNGKCSFSNDSKHTQHYQLNGTKYKSPCKVEMKHLNLIKVCDKQVSDKSTPVIDTKVVPPTVVPLKSESKSNEQGSSGCKNKVPDATEKVVKKTSNVTNSKEDEKLDIVTISNYLQAREKINFHSKNKEDKLDDVGSAQVLSITKDGFENSIKSEENTAEKNSKCFFLLRCQSLRHENAQQPCYICHKMYGSVQVLNIHFAQKHFSKDNVHVQSSLCERRKKETKETKKLAIESSENVYKLEASGMRTSNKSDTKQSASSVRYHCPECVATFHDSKTLNMHVLIYHKDDQVQIDVPLKQVSTPGGNRFYYCNKCSNCFHTEKGLAVHPCQPF